MPGLWIDESIMNLKRTPAETQLLARICYRAGIAKDGICRDSNTELSAAVNIHSQTVSDLVKKFAKDGLINSVISPERKNERSITPIRKILIPYKENADRYKEKTDSDYKEFPYSPPEADPTLLGNSLDPISQNLIDYKENPDSYNKDRKPLKTLLKTLLKKGGHFVRIRGKFRRGHRFVHFSKTDLWAKPKPTPVPRTPSQFKPPTIVIRMREHVKTRIEGYHWDGANGGAAKSLSDKLRAMIVSKNPNCTDDDVFNAFTVLIERTYELPKYFHFTDLPALNSKFNEILSQLRTAKAGSAHQPGQNRKTVAPAHATPEERASKIASIFHSIDSLVSKKQSG